MYSETIMLGVAVSMLYTELTGFSAGLIIPGCLALSLGSPLRIGFTLVIAAAAVWICRLAARVTILYGRRRFAFLMLLTFLLTWGTGQTGLFPVDVVGVVLPGLIARECDRQGFPNTILSIAVTTAFTALVLLLLGKGLPL